MKKTHQQSLIFSSSNIDLSYITLVLHQYFCQQEQYLKNFTLEEADIKNRVDEGPLVNFDFQLLFYQKYYQDDGGCEFSYLLDVKSSVQTQEEEKENDRGNSK